jgi:hypothetical protein
LSNYFCAKKVLFFKDRPYKKESERVSRCTFDDQNITQ